MNTISKHMAYYLLLAAVGLFVFIMLSGHAQAAETAQTASQTLTASLQDIIQQVTSGVKQGVSFLQQEIPDVIKQLLVWKAVASLVYALFGLCTIAVSIFLGFKLLKRPDRIDPNAYSRYGNYKMNACFDKNGDSHPGIVFVPAILAGIFIFGLCAASNIMTALQIYIAPKVWLIEYAASLVK